MKKGRLLFNDGWQFALTEPDSDMDALKNVHWYDVEIPHDWLIGDTANLYKSGCGWYRKSFTLAKAELSDGFILCFDGVYMDTTVYVNDKKVGEWKYGYTSFSFDISDYVKAGTNKILVRVNHKAPNTRWYSGAGIYRNVYLRHTSRLHIAEDGIYITTKCNQKITKENPGRWKVTINTELCGEADGSLVHFIYDPHGRCTAEIERRLCGDSDKAAYYTDAPMLWDILFPGLYTVRTVLKDSEGDILDTVENKFGFRTLDFDPKHGLSINGKLVKLRGVCLHHDLGALGAAVNYDATRRQLVTMKEMGVNAVRTSHNPPSREFMDICDELGLLVDSEFLDMWELSKNENDYARFFDEWYQKDVKAWICRDRNHPSIIMWSIGNEIHDTHKSERGLEVAKMLTEEIKKHDPAGNAVPTIGSNYMPWENAQKVADYLKIAGYNYAERLYADHHKKHPDWCIYGSETTSTVRSRGIYHFPADTALLSHDDMQCSDLGNSVVGWGASPIKSYIMDRDRKFCMGQFVWTGFDYIGEPTPYSTKNSYFGIVDTAGFPKDSFWFYKAVWNKTAEPFIHISPYWDFNEGQIIDVIVYSNLPVLKLRYKGEEYPTAKLDLEKGEILYGHWRLPYDEKKPVFVAGYNSEEDKEYVLEETITAAMDPVALDIRTSRTEIPADGRSMIFAEIFSRDFFGQLVPNANNRVKVTVTGAGRLVGLDNGDSTDYDSYKGDNRRLFSGRLLAMIEATFETGEITLTVESEGLEPKTVTLYASECDRPDGISVVTENTFPAVTNEYTNEIPIRKIELSAPSVRELNENQKTVRVGVKIFPENATYNDIGFKCCSDNGVEINFAEVTDFDGKTATVTAKGDGEFRLRAYAKNGSDIPKVISELEYKVTGLGEAVKNPYMFNAACLFDFSNVPVNTIERGALGGFSGRTVVGFSAVDFGKSGTDKLILSVGNCAGGEQYPVELYLGDPDKGGEYIGTFGIDFNGGWDRAYPQEFALEKPITGVHDISFVIVNSCIFGGFEFKKNERAYKLNYAAANDGVYGDDFTVNENRIEKIGNNVVIEFKDMDFKGGTGKIRVTGRTPLDFCTIQLRVDDENGVQTTRLLEFPHADEYTEVQFAIDKIAGKNDISFVFLPGTKFDMESFEFIKE